MKLRKRNEAICLLLIFTTIPVLMAMADYNACGRGLGGDGDEMCCTLNAIMGRRPHAIILHEGMREKMYVVAKLGVVVIQAKLFVKEIGG